MLTVIVPVFNVASYLEKCICSVLNQTYKDLEVLLINDGSTDHSGDICKRYAGRDSRIRYIEKNNEGSGKTRNLGIRLAKGEYITFLDSDDWWEDTYAEMMMACVDRADIVVCDMYYVYMEHGREIKHLSTIRMPDRLVQTVSENTDYINIGRTFLCGKVFRTSLFRICNIKQPSLPVNDIPIVPLLIALSTKICRVGEPLYNYLKSREGNTISSSKAIRSFGDALTEMKENFDRFGLTNTYEKALKKMYFSQVRFAVRKANTLLKAEWISKDKYEELKKYLFHVIGSFWPEWPNPDGKRFMASDDVDVNQAVKNILFDDSFLVKAPPYDYIVLGKEGGSDDGHEYPCQTISVKKAADLKGEDLWWQMADELLFSLSSQIEE